MHPGGKSGPLKCRWWTVPIDRFGRASWNKDKVDIEWEAGDQLQATAQSQIALRLLGAALLYKSGKSGKAERAPSSIGLHCVAPRAHAPTKVRIAWQETPEGTAHTGHQCIYRLDVRHHCFCRVLLSNHVIECPANFCTELLSDEASEVYKAEGHKLTCGRCS